ncbi:MAG: hypothetical protein ACE5J9_04380 [Methanosarcinales archaeon]
MQVSIKTIMENPHKFKICLNCNGLNAKANKFCNKCDLNKFRIMTDTDVEKMLSDIILDI